MQKNISKCRSDISGSFRRTPRHCAKWLQNSPGKHYQRIRICLTEEVETPSFPIQICLPYVKYPKKVERHQVRIPDVGYPEKMERRKGNRLRVHGVGTHPDSPRGHAACSRTRTPSGRSTRYSRTSHIHTIAYPIRICCPDHCPILLAFRMCLWKRNSKLRFFMFLSFPLLCHGFQRTLLNLGLLW